MADDFNPYYTWLGIPLAEQPPNRYRLLGLAVFESDPQVIAHAADRQMGYVRTFQTGTHSAASQKLLNELAASKLCLLNDGRRAAYDAELRAALAAKEVSPPPVAPPPAPAPLPPPEAPPIEAVEEAPPEMDAPIQPQSSRPAAGIRPRGPRTPDVRSRPPLERLRAAKPAAAQGSAEKTIAQRLSPSAAQAEDDASDEYTVLPLLPDQIRRPAPEPPRRRRQQRKMRILPVVFFAAVVLSVVLFMMSGKTSIEPIPTPPPPPPKDSSGKAIQGVDRGAEVMLRGTNPPAASGNPTPAPGPGTLPPQPPANNPAPPPGSGTGIVPHAFPPPAGVAPEQPPVAGSPGDIRFGTAPAPGVAALPPGTAAPPPGTRVRPPGMRVRPPGMGVPPGSPFQPDRSAPAWPPIDILALLAKQGHALPPGWHWDGDALVNDASAEPSFLPLPVELPATYTLEAILERKAVDAQPECLVFSLPEGGAWRDLLFDLDGCQTGFGNFEGDQGTWLEINTKRKLLLPMEARQQVDIDVRERLTTVEVNGHAVLFETPGRDQDRPLNKQPRQARPQGRIAIGSRQSFVISALKLVPPGRWTAVKRNPLPPVDASQRRVDMLSLINPQRDAYAGRWSREGGKLVSQGYPEQWRAIELPYSPGDAYKLTLKCASDPADAPSVVLGLAQGGQRFTAGIDPGGLSTGLCFHGRAYFRTGFFRLGDDEKDLTVSCFVSSSKVSLECNGRIVASWSGEDDQHDFPLVDDPRVAAPPDANRLFLCCQGRRFTVNDMQIERVDPPPSPDRPAHRQPVSLNLDESDLKAALRQIRKTYEEDYRAAKTPEQTRALVDRLVKESALANDSTGYVMLMTACAVSIEALRCDLALEALEQLRERFDVPDRNLEAAALVATACKPGESAAMWSVADQALSRLARTVSVNEQVAPLIAARLAAERTTPEVRARIAARIKQSLSEQRIFNLHYHLPQFGIGNAPAINPAVFGPNLTFVRPVPRGELTDATKKIREEFDLAGDAVTTPEQKLERVHRLVAAAADEEKGVREFAMLSLARDLAVDAGQWEEGLAPVERLESRFPSEPWKLQTAMLLSAARKGGEETAMRRLANRALWMAEIAVLSNLKPIADDLLLAASSAARDLPLNAKKPFADHAKDIRDQMKVRFAAALPAMPSPGGRSKFPPKPKLKY